MTLNMNRPAGAPTALRPAGRPLMITALLTPFDASGKVDHVALARHVEFLIESDVEGLLACGTTGEAIALTDEEVSAVVATVVAAADGRVAVIAHTGRFATRTTIRLALRAIGDGADAIAAVVPYYERVTDMQLVAHYRALARACEGTPVYAYTIPDRTGNDLPARSLVPLAEAGVAGLKDSTKSMPRLLEYLEVAQGLGAPFDVFTGADALVVDSLRAGATGSVNGIGNPEPEVFAELKAALLACDQDRVDAAGARIRALRDGLPAGPMLRGLKQATAARLARRGVTYPTALRGPLS